MDCSGSQLITEFKWNFKCMNLLIDFILLFLFRINIGIGREKSILEHQTNQALV